MSKAVEVVERFRKVFGSVGYELLSDEDLISGFHRGEVIAMGVSRAEAIAAELTTLRVTVAALRAGKAKWEARYASMTHSLGCDACEANESCEEGDRLADMESRAEQVDAKTKKGGA